MAVDLRKVIVDEIAGSADVISRPLSEVVLQHQLRMGIYGPTDAGKTWMCADFLNTLKETPLDPEEISIHYIDCDGKGIAGLVPQGHITEEMASRVEHYNCASTILKDGVTSFEKTIVSLIKATDALTQHVADNGYKGWLGAYIVFDDESDTWVSVRDWYAKHMYGLTFAQRVFEKRQKGWGEKGVSESPALDQMLDYGVINALYESLLTHHLRDCGFNFIITNMGRWDPLTVNRRGVYGKPDAQDLRYHFGGCKRVEQDVDIIYRLEKTEDGRRYAHLEKCRYGNVRFKFENPTAKKLLGGVRRAMVDGGGSPDKLPWLRLLKGEIDDTGFEIPGVVTVGKPKEFTPEAIIGVGVDVEPKNAAEEAKELADVEFVEKSPDENVEVEPEKESKKKNTEEVEDLGWD